MARETVHTVETGVSILIYLLLAELSPNDKNTTPDATRQNTTFAISQLIILIAEHFLATLSPGHTVLLLLPQLGGCELLGLLGRHDLVTHGVELLFLIIVITL